jgi:hypothetical protein
MEPVAIEDFRTKVRELEEKSFPLLSEIRSLEYRIDELRKMEPTGAPSDLRETRARNIKVAREQLKHQLRDGAALLSFFSWSRDLKSAGILKDIAESLEMASAVGFIPNSRFTFTNFEILRRLVRDSAQTDEVIDTLKNQNMNPDLLRIALEFRIEIEQDIEEAMESAIEEFFPIDVPVPANEGELEPTIDVPEALSTAFNRHGELGAQIKNIRDQIKEAQANYRAQVTMAIRTRPHLTNLDCLYVEKLLLEMRNIDENHFVDLSLDSQRFLEIVEFLVGAASTKVCAICFQFKNSSDAPGFLEHVVPNHFFTTESTFKMKMLVGIQQSWNFFMLSPDAREELLADLLAEGNFENELFDFFFQVKPIDSDKPPTRSDIQMLEKSVLPQMGVTYDEFRDALQDIKEDIPRYGATMRSFVQYVSRQEKPHILKAVASIMKNP